MRKIFRALIFVLIVFLVSVPFLSLADIPTAQEDKISDIQELLALTGAEKQAVSQMIGMYKVSMPQVPEEFWQGVINETSTSELNNSLVAIYDKYFTHEEIKDMVNFYKTPTGAKVLQVMPQIMQEAAVSSKKLAEEVNRNIVQKLKEKGY